ncbi:MAG: DegT/DnrJ/EryC1/StrS family aminotransferase, partial [Acidobacteria bacterium]|nr:DegT/DnrJ/EryC1/StrS family aminotransferase [Acidobacteriota bacterium]
GNEVRAIRAAGANIRFYPIHRDLQPDLDELERLCRSTSARVLYVIHYLGWPQPLEEITGLCRKLGILLIEDCALSLLSDVDGKPLGSLGEYSIFCLYKTLPVPNGGLVVQNRNILPDLLLLQLRPCGRTAVASRSLELMLERLRSRSNGLGKILLTFKQILSLVSNGLGVKRFPIGNSGFDPSHLYIGASEINNFLLRQFDYAAIRQQRRSNYLYLLARLTGKAALLLPKLAEGICPLFFPILVHDKRAAAQTLWRRGIGAVEFWNEGDAEVTIERFPDSHFLRKHVLELPIHQDICHSQLEYMANRVLQLDLL